MDPNSKNYDNTKNNKRESKASYLSTDEEPQTLNLDKYNEKLKYVFDYEINSIKLDDNEEMNCKMYFYDKRYKSYRIINYNSFNDKLRVLYKIPNAINDDGDQDDEEEKMPNKKAKNAVSIYDKDFQETEEKPLPDNVKTANFIKRMVSKQKRRYQDENFDLDLAFITERVIAMGYPSSGTETIYRNSVDDVIDFFKAHQYNNVKIYNLCLEKERIYPKSIFGDSLVGLFPATDHNPCPIKLILEFCIDICLYLINNPKGVAAVHCKAGKGRTGVMICSYLIFSCLCENSDKAFRYYARIRTKDNTGVTIPSQKRYIKYFETFLEANFCPPYIFLIPKIIKTHFMHCFGSDGRPSVKNVLQSFQKEKSYFISANKFKLRNVRIGPLPRNKTIKLKICNFINNNFALNEDTLYEEEQNPADDGDKNNDNKNFTYYQLKFDPELIIHSDIKITFSGGVNFYIWVNLWYSSWETIKLFYDKEQKIQAEDDKISDMDKMNNNDMNEVSNNGDYDTKSSHKKYENFNINTNINQNRKNNAESNSYENENNSYEQSGSGKENNRKSNQVKFQDHIHKKKSTLKNDDEEFNVQTMQGRSLYEIIFKLKHNTNLNELINKINLSMKKKIDPNNLVIYLNKDDLDKFEEKGQSDYNSIGVLMDYSLLNKHN